MRENWGRLGLCHAITCGRVPKHSLSTGELGNCTLQNKARRLNLTSLEDVIRALTSK